MCDMYGHGYWLTYGDEPYYNYLKYNSHYELVGAHPSIVELAKEDSVKWGPTPQTRFVFEMSAIPYGIDPVDGTPLISYTSEKWSQRPAAGEDAMEDKRYPPDIIRATWDKAFPDAKSLCPWIEAHCAKRGDYEDWAARGPLLLSAQCRAHLPRWYKIKKDDRIGYEAKNETFTITASMGQHIRGPFPRIAFEEITRTGRIPPATSAGDLIDYFRKWPNDFWKARATKGRYDTACKILEAAGLN